MKMKTILRWWIGVVAAAALVTAATGCASAPGDRSEVVASFYPLAYAAQQVGGGDFRVRNVTPAGAEPHDIEISPRDVQAVKEAGHVLLLGHGFQPQLERAAGFGGQTVRLLDTPGLHRFDNGDPHVWLDPHRYRLIVLRIGDRLGRRAEARQLGEKLRALDAEMRAALSNCARREIVTSHDAFAYLAQRYQLREIPVTGLRPEGEVKPGDLRDVMRRVRETRATTVFTETLVSPRIAKTVARETGARTAVLNPIEGLTPAEQARGEDYFSLMRRNGAALRRALGCR